MRNNPRALVCWHCGTHLKDIVLPIERCAQCPQCRADLHACRLCRHFDTRYTSDCVHQLADKVVDKGRVNHCTYFRERHHAYAAGDVTTSKDDRQALEALFGAENVRTEEPAPESHAELSRARKDRARRALDDLFGDDKER